MGAKPKQPVQMLSLQVMVVLGGTWRYLAVLEQGGLAHEQAPGDTGDTGDN